MSLPIIDVAAARRLVDQGAVLVDIREADEHARERVPGARHNPLSRLAAVEAPAGSAVIFHCRSGARTAANAQRLAGAASCQAYILEGGLEAWKKAGLPVVNDRRQPIAITRQVRIVAGGLFLTGVVLGLWLTPAFFGLSVFAGISGRCGMARLLSIMPWNRPSRRVAA